MKDATNRSVAGHQVKGGMKVYPPRRQYTAEQKRQIVEEASAPGASVSIVARRHDVNANLVFTWRKQYQQGNLVDSTKAMARAALPAPPLIRVGVVDHDGTRPPPVVTGKATASPANSRRSGTIEITLRGGTKVRVDAGISEAALRLVLAVVKDVA
jgi:transposase